MTEPDTHKYLGILQARQTERTAIMTTELSNRLQETLETNLNSNKTL
jgi:hypothetical protein